MNKHEINIDHATSGVLKTKQKRSRASRDAFIESGIVLLNQMRFADLKINDLAQHCNRSVGSFYKRFEDKDAYFRALQATTVERNKQLVDSRLNAETLAKLDRMQVLDELVDTLSDIFAGETRGILRESLLRILEPVDGWAPMRASGRDVQQRIVDRLKSEFIELGEAETERKLRFCYQIIAGVLQNDLVNDFHMFTTRDKSIRAALKASVRDHMNSTSRY